MSGDKPITQGAVYDAKLLFPVLFLVGIGIVMVYSASSAHAARADEPGIGTARPAFPEYA